MLESVVFIPRHQQCLFNHNCELTVFFFYSFAEFMSQAGVISLVTSLCFKCKCEIFGFWVVGWPKQAIQRHYLGLLQHFPDLSIRSLVAQQNAFSLWEKQNLWT